ncbi:hypothetical protein HH212_00045 [Massilia forsythiae]|uniref:Uncharacterized protein n=1 Tax=Massilia forsythiae TaxID=2728020 RepID=A0A7Z2ZQZ8_9BURK|nr:hypothetical protein [Massilia forsythiae]QJD98628.1 hypothetical protein HH212_00045 [Massilia forsythiae]
MNFQLGYIYRDKITGFMGVATGYVEYLTGCNQVLVAPRVAGDGTMRDSQWFDVQRLERQAGDQIQLENGETPGCDRAAPRR